MSARANPDRHPGRWALAASLALLAAPVVCSCRQQPTAAGTPADPPPTLTAAPLTPASTVADTWVDCVGALQVRDLRGYKIANAHRVAEPDAGVDPAGRLGDLGPEDLRSYCDWEACLRANGYGHVCWVDDAGVERCRVCEGGDDCGNAPVSRDDCVTQATNPGRTSCGIGLLEECLLQRMIRGPADPRDTTTCQLSDAACAGAMPGDLGLAVAAARHETDQVTIEEGQRELGIAAQLTPDASLVSFWQQQISTWEGGLPADAGRMPSDGP
jgi:hypothetical protein